MDEDENDNFFSFHDIEDKTDMQMAIIITYYAFTSLSTVGFGDYAPRSNAERIFISISLFTGVIMFSYIMTNLNEMINQMRVIDQEFDDDENLS